MRDADLVFAWLVLGCVLWGSGEVRRPEMFARTLLTGLRDEEEVDDDEGAVKLNAEDVRRPSELLDSELSYVWRGPVVVRIDRDLVACCVGIVVCVVAC
jgi:hypothetical protein